MAIIEVPDISIVKTVNGSKRLLSLRDQKIKKDGALHTFGTGSGIKHNGDLYVLNAGDELEPIVTMTTTINNPSFSISKNGDIEIDWGDGIRDKNTFSHTYSDGLSSHEIKFYGSNTALTYLNCDNNQLTTLDVSKNTKLTRLDCYENQLTTLDVSKNTELTYLDCILNPILNNQSNMMALANSLPDRTGKKAGTLMILNKTAIGWIQEICDAKNWQIE